MMWKTVAVGALVVLFLSAAGAARAETISANVAVFQPVTADSGTWSTTATAHTWDYYVTDDTPGSYVAAANNGTSGLWIDLGGLYNIESLSLWSRGNTGSYWNLLRGAKLYGYLADKTTQVGDTLTVPNPGAVYSATVTPTNWGGVQWIKLADESTGSSAYPTTMTLKELRVFAQVQTYNHFITGVTATASRTYAGASAVMAQEYLVNNMGMADQRGPVGAPTALSIPDGPMWTTPDATAGDYVTFDLPGDAPMALRQMLIWNANQTTVTDRGIKGANIGYSTDGGSTYTPLADMNGDDLGNYTIPKADEAINNPYQLAVNLGGLTADHVRITGLSNWGGGLYGLSEVRFYEVPEPSALVLLVGLGLLGLVRRRRP